MRWPAVLKFLICDEPTTALDVTIQAQILELIKELQEEYQFTTIFITHDLGVVASIADKVAVMYGGQIIESGTVEEIFMILVIHILGVFLSALPQLAQKVTYYIQFPVRRLLYIKTS